MSAATPPPAPLWPTFLPAPQWTQRRALAVAVPAARAFAALTEYAPRADRRLRPLLALRDLPARLRHGRAAGLALANLPPLGMAALKVAPSQALILGFSGAFWQPTAALRLHNGEDFFAPLTAPGIKLIWEFSVHAEGAGRCRIDTVLAAQADDAQAQRAFAAYWRWVRWPSGWLRLALVRRACAMASIV